LLVIAANSAASAIGDINKSAQIIFNVIDILFTLDLLAGLRRPLVLDCVFYDYHYCQRQHGDEYISGADNHNCAGDFL
jgi:hypothetical protein